MKSIRKLGCITIGQSPRVDVLPDLQKFLFSVEIIQRGALDGFSQEQLKEIAPEETCCEGVLISRLQNGNFVRIKEAKILPLLQKSVTELNAEGVDGIMMLCTGTFPKFTSEVPIWYPQELMHVGVKSLFPEASLGIITPDKNQLQEIRDKWSGYGYSEVRTIEANPYGAFDLIIEQAQILAGIGVDIIILDCIGYTEAMKQGIQEKTGLVTILGKTLAARMVSELI